MYHAADDFNIVTSLRHHPATSIFYWIIVVAPALLFSTEAMLVGMIIVNGHSTYVHADLPTSRVFERWFFFGPNGHGIHHGTVPSCFDKNFGDLVIWDRLFGTYKTDAPQSLVYGCADPEGIYQSGHPLRDMVAVQMSWLRTLWNAARSRSASAAQAA
jgi:alkylglycerol monooxygenase